MNRFTTLLGLLLATSAAVAQVAPERYFPLAVGDRWEYEVTHSAYVMTSGGVTFRGIARRVVVGDTLIGGASWAVVSEVVTDLTGAPRSTARFAVRVASGTIDYGCTSFCLPVRSVDQVPPPGAAPGSVTIQGVPYAVAGVGQTWVDLGPGGPIYTEVYRSYAADIGMTGFLSHNHSSGGNERYEEWALGYAVVGGQVYGLHPVAADPAPLPPVLALSAAPNPARGPATLRLTLPAAGAVRVEAYDALGRRVHAADLGARPAGTSTLSLDTSAWAPGPYVVRVTTGDGHAATARLVRLE